MILLIDNYDSFTYNLYQYFAEFVPDIQVVRNDKINVETVEALNPEAIVISPGPGRPEQAGACIPIIQAFYKRIPMLGICLGHQAIAAAFNAHITHAPTLMHAKQTHVFHQRDQLFKDLHLPFLAGRYHSLVVKPDSLPDCFNVTAETGDGIIMAIKHCDYPIYGVQFHPESVLTEDGIVLIRNFICLIRERQHADDLSTKIIEPA